MARKKFSQKQMKTIARDARLRARLKAEILEEMEIEQNENRKCQLAASFAASAFSAVNFKSWGQTEEQFCEGLHSLLDELSGWCFELALYYCFEAVRDLFTSKREEIPDSSDFLTRSEYAYDAAEHAFMKVQAAREALDHDPEPELDLKADLALEGFEIFEPLTPGMGV